MKLEKQDVLRIFCIYAQILTSFAILSKYILWNEMCIVYLPADFLEYCKNNKQSAGLYTISSLVIFHSICGTWCIEAATFACLTRVWGNQI